MLRLRTLFNFVLLLGLATVAAAAPPSGAPGIVVLQTDFGLKDQAVAAMRGVIRNVDRELIVDDLTHEIPAYNVWEAAYRLNAVVDYWPKDAVFVSVVDPGVGTSRKSVVARLKNGLTIVTPDNGTLTLVAQRIGIDAIREIDERKHRLPGSEGSYTFHGRDVYAYNAALLASGKMKFDDVGPLLESGIVEIRYEKAGQSDGRIFGGIPVLDPQYGNIWTNIPAALLDALNVHAGDRLQLTITEGGVSRIVLTLPFAHTFGDVPVGQPLLYVNSVGMLAIAINQKNFASAYNVTSGPTWRVEFTRASAGSP
jgi:S-adenosylmethionine hydrolase